MEPDGDLAQGSIGIDAIDPINGRTNGCRKCVRSSIGSMETSISLWPRIMRGRGRWNGSEVYQTFRKRVLMSEKSQTPISGPVQVVIHRFTRSREFPCGAKWIRTAG